MQLIAIASREIKYQNLHGNNVNYNKGCNGNFRCKKCGDSVEHFNICMIVLVISELGSQTCSIADQ